MALSDRFQLDFLTSTCLELLPQIMEENNYEKCLFWLPQMHVLKKEKELREVAEWIAEEFDLFRKEVVKLIPFF